MDKVVAVDETNALPAPVREALLASADFENALAEQIETADKPGNVAVRDLIEAEVTTEGRPAHDVFLEQIHTDLVTPGGDTNTAVRSIVQAAAVPEQIFIPAARFDVVVGSPVKLMWPSFTFPPAFHMDSAAIETIVTVADSLPIGWLTYDVSVLWVPPTTNNGFVVWEVHRSHVVEGLTPEANAVTNRSTQEGLGIAGNLQEVKVSEGVARVASPLIFRVSRIGNSVSDTFNTDAAFVGLRLTRLT